MVRKRRTELPAAGQSSESGEIGGGSGGAQRLPAQQLQQPQQPVWPQQQQQGGYQGGGRGMPQHGGYAGQSSAHREIGGASGGVQRLPAQQQGERGWAPQPGGYAGQSSESREIGVGSGVVQRQPAQLQQQGGGRGWAPQRGGYAGRGGPGGRMPPHQYGGDPEYHQGRGGPQYQQGGSPPPQRPAGGYGGGRGISSAGGPSRQGPNLHQADMVSQPSPFSGPGKVNAGPSSSSQPSEPSASDVVEQTQQLSLSTEVVPSPVMQPASSKSVRFPPRPGKGTRGNRCLVKANHFFVELPDKDLHHYDVSINPEVPSRGVNRAIINQLVKLYKDSHLGKRLPAYDGRKSLYTAGPLPFESKEFNINLGDEGGAGGSRRERKFKVVIRFAGQADLHHLGMFLQGRRPDAPQEALQVLDIVLRQLPTSRPTYTPFGRSFFSPDLGRKESLGEGVESWPGYYQSMRPTQMGLSLNIDMSATAFIHPIPVVDFVDQLLPREASARRFNDAEHRKITQQLKGVKVEVTHRKNVRRKYRIGGLTSKAVGDLTFEVDDGTMKSVVEYFREKYGVVIQRTLWPCLQVGNSQKPIYMPMEVCKIVEGQRYSKKLNDRQTTALLRVTCQKPEQREKDIIKTVEHNAYNDDEYAKEFGIKINYQPATVEARVLPPPRLKYHETGREKDCTPQVGQWNMMNKKMYIGGTVGNWACINFARNIQVNTAHNFCAELAFVCNTSGMTFNPEPALPVFMGWPDYAKRSLDDVVGRLRGKKLDLLIVILPDVNGSLYGELKRICETELDIVSQCCLAKNVHKMNRQYLANVSLKINVKAGGSNTALADALSRRIPVVSAVPTIIFGADVTHPQPGEDSSPSIAAVVASQDLYLTKYAALVRAQAHRQEIIQDLAKMVRELLLSYNKLHNLEPKRIIFYRDGVSEGQFSQVLSYELDAIWKACRSLSANYKPLITFVVIQKRHHTRLFANNHRDRGATDRSGNILPGTVVDSKICHPTEFDFYLCSHAGIQGTSRPAHYHVLWDDNRFSADDLQSFTNNLCYTFARCTRSVSIVPPAYYAHLAAFRARFYMVRGGSDAGGGGAPGNYTREANARVTRLPDIMGSVKNVMFFC